MAATIQLEVITPERRVLSEAVDAVQVPGANGELGILPGHTPLISQINSGVLSYTQGAASERLHVAGGFVEVSNDRVTVLADVAERPAEIDAARARAARERYERQLSSFSGDAAEFEEGRMGLERATTRLQLAEGSATASAR